MNYKELVDRIRQVVFDHKMLVDFGYGQISDIKVRSEGEGEDSGADYPYCFLNPQPHVRTQTEITYNFNMIVMDMAREEEGDEYQNFLAIQSDCMQYIDDIIARLYYHYTDKPEVSFDLNYTPFYERFQDDLAGATANLAITVPTNINDCITPFDNWELIAEGSIGPSPTEQYNDIINTVVGNGPSNSHLRLVIESDGLWTNNIDLDTRIWEEASDYSCVETGESDPFATFAIYQNYTDGSAPVYEWTFPKEAGAQYSPNKVIEWFTTSSPLRANWFAGLRNNLVGGCTVQQFDAITTTKTTMKLYRKIS